MKPFFLSLFAGLVLSSTFAQHSGQFIFTLPQNWSVQYQTKDRLIFYIFFNSKAQGSVFNFNKWLGPEQPSDIPSMVKRDAPPASLIGNFVGMSLAGTFAKYNSDRGLHVRFMFSKNGEIWNGMFFGSEEQWAEAFKILKTIQG